MNRLVLLTSLAITALISLPRLLLLQRMAPGKLSFETSLADLSLRAFYIFLTSILFFIIHLHTRCFRVSFIRIDFNSFWQRLLISIVAFVILDRLLLRFHMLLFPPYGKGQFFRFL